MAIVLFGQNDITVRSFFFPGIPEHDTADIEANVLAIRQELSAAGSIVVIGTPFWRITRSRDPILSDYLDVYNNGFSELRVALRNDRPLARFWGARADHFEFGVFGFHPSESGREFMAARAERAIRKALRRIGYE